MSVGIPLHQAQMGGAFGIQHVPPRKRRVPAGEKQREAFEALREHAPRVMVIKGPGQSYVKEDPRSLDEALDLYGLTPERDKAGNIILLSWDAELSGYEELTRMCERLSGLVRPGSYIQAEGSDGSIWRRLWRADGKLHVVEGRLAFEYPPRQVLAWRRASTSTGRGLRRVALGGNARALGAVAPGRIAHTHRATSPLEPRLGRRLEEMDV